jgi:hypothetical protein
LLICIISRINKKMVKKAFATLGLSLALAFPVLALASPITWSFSGYVIAGYGVDRSSPDATYTGRAVTGSITVDPILDTNQCVGNLPNDETSWFGCSAPTLRNGNPNGFASDGYNLLTVDGESIPAESKIGLYRNSPAGGGNYNSVYLAVTDSATSLDLLVQDSLGNNSKIFDDANGALAWDQPINWFAQGAQSLARIGNSGLFEQVLLDSVTISGNGVSTTQYREQQNKQLPEPTSIALLGLGMFCFAAARHRPARSKR